jgi:protein required for attachment to host cells
MLNSKTIWIIFANTTKAEIYKIKHPQSSPLDTLEQPKKFSLIEVLEHPESRLKSKDLTSDRAGRYKTDHSTHGAFISSADPHQEVHYKFAKEISHLLEKGLHQNQYQKIILCVEPHFYGLLNETMPTTVQKCVIRTIEKDYLPFPKPKMHATIENIIQETKISS